MAELDLARVKRNIGKMIDQGAPESDIDSYIGSEGVTLDMLKAAPRAGAMPAVAREVTAPPEDEKAAFSVSGRTLRGKADPSGADMQSARDVARAGVYGAARGVSMEGLDEFSAGLNTAVDQIPGVGRPDETMGQAYDRHLATARERLKQSETDFPKTTLAGQVAGGVLPVVAGGTTALGAKALGMAGGLTKRAAMSAGSGAAIGGTTGYLGGEGENRADEAVRGAQWGGGAGAIAPIAGRAVGALVGKARDEIAARTVAVPGARPSAATALERSLLADQAGAGALESRLGALGPEGMIADVGPNTRALAAGVAGEKGSGGQVLADAMASRTEGAGTRLEDTLSKTAGPRINEVEKLKELVTTRKANADRLYGSAFDNPRPVDVTPALSAIDSEIAPGVSARIGTGVKPDQTTAALQEARSLIAGEGSQAFDLRTLHRAQDRIDDLASAASSAGRNNEARPLGDVRRIASRSGFASSGWRRPAKTAPLYSSFLRSRARPTW